MPLFRQEEILERYLELFSAKYTQFVFVAGLGSWGDKPSLPSCFETSIELHGFPRKDHVAELINRANPAIAFEPEAVEVLWEEYHGHPRFTVEACFECFEAAARASEASISRAIAQQVCLRQAQRREEQESLSPDAPSRARQARTRRK